MQHYPALLSKEQLSKLLRHMAELVETGDSFEGSLEYLIPDIDPEPKEGEDFAVTARFRIGNLDGQGGMRFIGELK